jgi:hypothetical protein
MKYLKSYSSFGLISEALASRVGRTGQLCLHKTDSKNLESYVNDGILKSKYSHWQRGAGQTGIFFLTGTDESSLFSETEMVGRGDNGLIVGKYLDLSDTTRWNIDYEFEASAVSHFLVKNLRDNMPEGFNLYYLEDKTHYQKFSGDDWNALEKYVELDGTGTSKSNMDFVPQIDGYLYLIKADSDQVNSADLPEHQTQGPIIFQLFITHNRVTSNKSNAWIGDFYNDLFWAKLPYLRSLRDKIDRDVLEYMNKTGNPFAIKYMAELGSDDRFPDRFWIKEADAWKEYSYPEAKRLVQTRSVN